MDRSAYYFQADALALRVGELRARPLGLDVTTLAPDLTNRDLGFPFQTGTRLTLGQRFCDCSALEATYFGLMDWDSSASVTDPNNLRLPGDIGLATDDFFGADRFILTQKTQINNAELNYLFPQGDRLQWLAGVRYFNFSEQANLHAIDSDGEESDYRVTANNHLIGAQIGALKNFRYGKFVLSPIGKAGIYGNVQRASTSLRDFDNSVLLRNLTVDDGTVSFLGEVGVNGTYFLTKCFALRGGYNNYWLTGLARGTNQFDFTDTPSSSSTVANDSGAYLHGFNGGIEVFW